MKTLPAVIDEADAVAVICHWIDLVAASLAADASRLVLRDRIRWMVRSGAIPTIQVIQAARAGHADADQALRELAVEMMSRREEMPTELAAYAQEALLRPLVSYPRGGHDVADLWLRNIGIAVLVSLAMERWGVRATRNRASKRASASSLVSAALVRRGINVSVAQVERIYADQGTMAEQLSASIPFLNADDNPAKG